MATLSEFSFSHSKKKLTTTVKIADNRYNNALFIDHGDNIIYLSLLGLQTIPSIMTGIVDQISSTHIKGKTELALMGSITDDKLIVIAYNISGYALNATLILKKIGT